ncbi:hypothetical protein BJX63DRAFT_379803 [Aspergillus granulosus]|uniref:SnoaL-like domain-containing protein n=1 Tax=Aspergillus granulosus TaxID=176169 RepID=A0ABR4HYS9_9EURO
MPSFVYSNRFAMVKPPSAIHSVTTEERTSAIDFVNGQNYIFQEFNHECMLSTFLPDAVVYHSEGTLRGHAALKAFFKASYGRVIPGVCRSATNHIVDRGEEDERGIGVIVRYQQYLIRYGWEKDDENATEGKDTIMQEGLPAIWWFGSMVDRLRMTDAGWKVYERYLGPSFRNSKLDMGQGAKI